MDRKLPTDSHQSLPVLAGTLVAELLGEGHVATPFFRVARRRELAIEIRL